MNNLMRCPILSVNLSMIADAPPRLNHVEGGRLDRTERDEGTRQAIFVVSEESIAHISVVISTF